VRRLLAICTVTLAIIFALAVSHMGCVTMASSPTGFIIKPPDPLGCALDPAVAFCSQIPGTTSQPLKFTVLLDIAVSNPSVILAAVPGLSANFAEGDFMIATNTCTGSFTAGQSCMIAVTFSPTTIGLREAALTFNGVDLVNLAGTGATLVMTPPSPPSGCNPQDNAFTYCNVPVGSTSGTQVFTLTSANTITSLNVAPAAVPGLAAEFNAADFTIESTTCTGTLAANTSCTINVAFTPTNAGLRETTLTARDSEGDTAAVYLAGHTTTGLLLTPVLTPASATCLLGSFEFCNEPIGGTTASSAFMLTNTAGVQITGISMPAVSVAGNFKVANTSCVSILTVDASCTINVIFTPQAAGLLQDTIKITDDAGDIGAANFAGTGDDYELQLANGQASERTVMQGGTITFQAQTVSDGVFGQNGEQVAFFCPSSSNLPAFASCVTTPCPGHIPPNSTVNFQIVFVTSSASFTAPLPEQSTPPGCTAYGVQSSSGLATPRAIELVSSRPKRTFARTPLFPSLAMLAMMGTLGAMGFVRARYHWIPALGRRAIGPVLVIFALAVGIAMTLSGCHHGSSTSSSGTPVGQTMIQIQGVAFDSQGNPLNATRDLPVITIDVVAQ
jgi:hypothetical protein